MSSSAIICPVSVSMSIILPGWRLPFARTLWGSIFITPVSDAITRRPSSVTRYLEGRRPLRSSIPPAYLPSVKSIAAGPSQGSIKMEWYS